MNDTADKISKLYDRYISEKEQEKAMMEALEKMNRTVASTATEWCDPYGGISISPLTTISPAPHSVGAWVPYTPASAVTKTHTVKIRVNPDKYLTKEDMLRDVKKRAAAKIAAMLIEEGSGVKVESLPGNKGSKSKVLQLSIDLVVE